MDYKCSVCSQVVRGDMMVYLDHSQKHVVDLIKHDHPEWVDAEGVCQRCVEYYQAEIKGAPFGDAPCAVRQRFLKKVWNKIKNLFKPKAS